MSSKTSSTVKRAHSTPNTERGATRIPTYTNTYTNTSTSAPLPAYIVEVEPPTHPAHPHRNHRYNGRDPELREVLREAGWYGLAPGPHGLRAKHPRSTRRIWRSWSRSGSGAGDPDFPLDSDFEAVEGDAE